jgi:hypothetical protein
MTKTTDTHAGDDSRVPLEPTGAISDLAIDALRSEAAEAGNLEAVALCDRALRGDGAARARCAAAIRAVAGIQLETD